MEKVTSWKSCLGGVSFKTSVATCTHFIWQFITIALERGVSEDWGELKPHVVS